MPETNLHAACFEFHRHACRKLVAVHVYKEFACAHPLVYLPSGVSSNSDDVLFWLAVGRKVVQLQRALVLQEQQATHMTQAAHTTGQRQHRSQTSRTMRVP